MMNNETDIRLIDTHAKCNSCDHRLKAYIVDQYLKRIETLVQPGIYCRAIQNEL